jgi:hypothetical protein
MLTIQLEQLAQFLFNFADNLAEGHQPIPQEEAILNAREELLDRQVFGNNIDWGAAGIVPGGEEV